MSKIPMVNTSLELLILPKENLKPVDLEADFFLVVSPFFLKVLVLGELVAMYSFKIRF
ncbi:hypothetical protein [Algoriphagus halophilus]|uniref:hypothetical protein n=1 Tax=Algoriphagus halophilus TaxID=226505 RepID=UPI001F330EA8|nr:hypothetical protein [Algoriphagus halophilus]